MSYIKKVKYKNELGQELVFDNHLLFCEQIDTTGTQGVFNTESLAFSDGQMTTSAFLGAKTIPCSFAFKDVGDDILMRDKISAVFNPTISGVLTVYSEWDKYEIDVRPSAVPSFQRDKDVPYVWRWDVDFIADFPYWRRGKKRSRIIEGKDIFSYAVTTHSVRYAGIAKSYPSFVFAPNTICYLQLYNSAGYGSFSINSKDESAIIVDCATMEIKNSAGDDRSQYLETSNSISGVFFVPGENKIECRWYRGNSGLTIGWYDYFLGVF